MAEGLLYDGYVIIWDTHDLPISVVAAIFFDQKPYWIRYQEKQGHLEGIGSRKPGGDRAYTLVDVRQMAHSLHHFGAIDHEGFKNCIARIDSISRPVFKRSRKK